MYLIKKVCYDYRVDSVIVKNGIRIVKVPETNEIVSSDNFWGKTQIHMGEYADYSKMPKIPKEENWMLLTYASEIDEKDECDGYKEISLNVSTYQPENIEGYLILLPHENEIKTNGKKIFGRYPEELVAIIKNGEFIEFSGRRIEVINNKLMLFI